MGLFDGVFFNNCGSVVDFVVVLGLFVVLVVDVGKMVGLIVLLVFGFVGYFNDIIIVGVILNNVGSLWYD